MNFFNFSVWLMGIIPSVLIVFATNQENVALLGLLSLIMVTLSCFFLITDIEVGENRVKHYRDLYLKGLRENRRI